MRRLGIALLGYLLAGLGVLLAWTSGAGVEGLPPDYASGPASSSFLLLGVCVGLLIAGAATVAAYGSQFGSVPESPHAPSASTSARAGRRRGRFAILLVVFGVGLLLTGLALPICVPLFALTHGPTPLYLSGPVLAVPDALDASALVVLAAGIALFALERKHHPSEFHAWWRRTGRYVTIAGIALVLIVAAELLVPVEQSFSTQLVTRPGSAGGIAFVWFSPGLHVTGSWGTNPTGPVNFTIQGPSGSLLYSVNATSGAFSFETHGVPWSEYTFFGQSGSVETVTITGTYLAPNWQWYPGEPGSPS